MLDENTQGADELMEDPDFCEVVDDPQQPADTGGQSAAPAPEFEPFSLTKERFTLSSINTRGEKHGDERVPALDLKFTATLSNSILLKLHPGLRDALYVQDRQRDIESDYGRKLKFPLLGTMPYDLEVPRVKLRVHDCDSESNDVVLSDGKANKFKIAPMEGGSVAIAFRVQFSDYDTDVLAALARVLQQSVPISLASESSEAEPETIEEQVEKATKKPKSAALLAAEAAFEDPTDPTLDLPFDPPAPNAAEEQNDAGIAVAEAAEADSNVMPIKAGRKKRAATAVE